MQVDLTLILVITYWFVLSLTILGALSIVFTSRSFMALACGLFVVNFLGRVLAIGINESIGLFEPKYMGELSIDLFNRFVLKKDYLGLIGEEFGAQVFWNLPVWSFTDATRATLLMSNAAAGALIPSIAGLIIRPATNRKTALATAILFSLYLGGFNFSMFGLRDPLLMLANTLIAAPILNMGLGRRGRAEIATLVVGIATSMWLRPEQFFIIAFVVCLPFIAYYLMLFLKRKNRRRGFAAGVMLAFPVIGVGLGCVFLATYVAGSNIGAQTINPLEIAGDRAEERFARHSEADFGGGSHIVDSQTYINMPVYIRVPVQIVGLVVLPYPWMINDSQKVMAFVDSLFLMGLIWLALGFAARPWLMNRERWTTLALLSCFAIGIAGMGFVVSNAGNGFRMRASVVPFLAVAAGAAVGLRSQYGRYSYQ